MSCSFPTINTDVYGVCHTQYGSIPQLVVCYVGTGTVEPTSTSKDDLTHVYHMENDIHSGIVNDFARAARKNNPNTTPSDVGHLLNGMSEFP